MGNRRTQRPIRAGRAGRRVWPVCAVALVAAGCVEPFGGSSLQINFDEPVPLPGANAAMPANTFLTAYAVEFVFERDEDGEVVIGLDGTPVIADTAAFPVVSFELRPVIDTGSPCFIELEDSRFPGLHSTRYAAKLREVTGVADPIAPPPGTPDTVIGDLLDADRRVGFMGALQGAIKAVTSASNSSYPVPGNQCVADGGDPSRIPPPGCIDDASNEVRLAVCAGEWARDPSRYEGNDETFTVPKNGDFFGTVTGMNPINGGFVGGAGFFVDAVLEGFDSLLLNWQFKDLDGDGEPDYPDDFPMESSIGFHFMQGAPMRDTRGTLNVPLANNRQRQISGEAVIFADLDRDDVNF